MVAGRLAEDTNARILLVEAGPHNKDLENVHMVGGTKRTTQHAADWYLTIAILIGWSKCFDSETDWNLVTKPMDGVDGRQVKLSRGKFLVSGRGDMPTLASIYVLPYAVLIPKSRVGRQE